MSAGVPWQPRGLVARLYLFGLAQVLVVMVVVPWLASLSLRPPTAPRELAAIAARILTAATWRHDPERLQRELVGIYTVLHGEVTLYDRELRIVATNVQPPLRPPFDLVGPQHFAEPPHHHHDHDHDHEGHGPSMQFFFGEAPHPRHPPPCFVVPLPGPEGGYGVYGMPPPSRFPLPALATIVALIGCAVLSVLLARSFASPLARLAATARAFGDGDLGARTGLTRGDEFGEVGRSFDAMAERVARLIRAQHDLLANVSHELRTPLARIRVALDLASEGDATTAREALADITTDLDELEQLVGDVLANARLEGVGIGASAPGLRRDVVTIQTLVDRAALRFASRHPQRTLDVDARDTAVTLEVDAALLRRALDNLLDNAAKYSEVTAPIALRTHADADTVIFEIEDRGIGIAAEDIALVGTPFFRTDQSRARATGGVGLGVALARRVAEAHGGGLKIDSVQGVGTTVVVSVARGA